MPKKIILSVEYGIGVLALGVALWMVMPVRAITMTPTVAPTNSVTPVASTSATLSETPEPDIRALRDRIASKAAQLRKKDEQVIAGEVTGATEVDLKIMTQSGQQETLELDDSLTHYFKFTGSAKEDIQKKDITVGSYVLALGPRNEGKISVNEVYVDEIFQTQAGRVVEVDGNTSTLKVDTYDKASVIVTVDNKTAITSMNAKTLVVAPSTFAKIKEGDVVHLIYHLTNLKQKTDKVTATQILHIPADYFNQ